MPNRSKTFGGFFDGTGIEEQLSELDREMQAPDFWNNPEKSKVILQKRRAVERRAESLKKLYQDQAELATWRELIGEIDGEIDDDALAFLDRLDADLSKLDLELKLSGPDDGRPAIVSIHPGAGGTESQDWASMLLRMYLRYCEQHGFDLEELDHQDGDEAGIKSSTFAVRGENAFGYLKSEAGVHRLVRISPYDAAARRHTSFASVSVCPEVDDEVQIEINDKDLRVDTYRSSGAGGQHVNKTDSAVRLTHLPTGVVVACQNERSQIKNRATAMKILRSRLYDLEVKKRQEAQQALEDAKMDNAWGSQIRSYVLHPYRMVKDHRTGVELGDAQAVLDGRLDPFIEGYLKGQMAAPGESLGDDV